VVRKLTLMLAWGGEGGYPEMGLSGHCPGPWLPNHWNGEKDGFLPSTNVFGMAPLTYQPMKAASPSLPPCSQVLQLNGQGFSRSVFTLLQKQRFRLVSYALRASAL